uniref:Uncharacterized protein n=1 Tax=Steinernema glaseri TaxID=37863 RepID=A0A1I7Z6Y7_9BILA
MKDSDVMEAIEEICKGREEACLQKLTTSQTRTKRSPAVIHPAVIWAVIGEATQRAQLMKAIEAPKNRAPSSILLNNSTAASMHASALGVLPLESQ